MYISTLKEVTMPLYDVKAKPREITPKYVEEFDVMKKAKKEFSSATWDKFSRTVDNSIEHLKPSTNSKLIWTKSGSIFGYKSKEPVEAINHIWEWAIKLWGDEDKTPLLFVGSFLMWRISLRPEIWLSIQNETGKIDPLTEQEITERHYWINNNFKIEQPPTIDDLLKKYNKHKG